MARCTCRYVYSIFRGIARAKDCLQNLFCKLKFYSTVSRCSAIFASRLLIPVIFHAVLVLRRFTLHMKYMRIHIFLGSLFLSGSIYILILFLFNLPRSSKWFNSIYYRAVPSYPCSFLIYQNKQRNEWTNFSLMAQHRSIDRPFNLNRCRMFPWRSCTNWTDEWHRNSSDEKFELQKRTRKSGYSCLSIFPIVLSVFTSVIVAYKSWKKEAAINFAGN